MELEEKDSGSEIDITNQQLSAKEKQLQKDALWRKVNNWYSSANVQHPTTAVRSKTQPQSLLCPPHHHTTRPLQPYSRQPRAQCQLPLSTRPPYIRPTQAQRQLPLSMRLPLYT
jgi:hypothetical protein